jgi:DNA-binding response OmpR family regulator
MAEPILVVADDSSTGATLAAVLTTGDYHAVRVSSLHQARQRLATQPFAAVLLAAQLPDGSGVCFCQELRAMLDLRVVIIVVCPPGFTWTTVVALEVGADDVVTTPVVPDELLARLGAHLWRCAQ